MGGQVNGVGSAQEVVHREVKVSWWGWQGKKLGVRNVEVKRIRK